MKPLSIVILLFILAASARAQDASLLLTQASSLSEKKDYTAAIRLLRSNENRFTPQNGLSDMYGNLSWYYLFTRHFDSSEQSARKGLIINPGQTWIKTNLAHAFLLQGKTAEAAKIYAELAGTQNGKTEFDTYTNDLLSDFEALEKAALIPAGSQKDFEQLKARITKNQDAIQIFKAFFKLCVDNNYEKALPLLHPYLDDLPQKHALWAAYILSKASEKYPTGNYKTSRNPYRLEAATLHKKILGKALPDPKWLIELGNIYYRHLSVPDLSLAEYYFLNAKTIQEKTTGTQTPAYATTLNYLANLYSDLADYTKAEKYYLDAIAVQEKTLGKANVDYAISLSNLGSLYSSHLENTAQAEKYFLAAKEIYEKILAQDHPNYTYSAYAFVLSYLGSLYSDLGKYEDAEKYLLKTREIREKIVGKNHPNYANSLYNLATLYQTMGDYNKAAQLLLETKAIQEKVLGKNHPDYASTLSSLGGLYQGKSDYQKAAAYYLEAQRIYATAWGKNHPDYASILNNLGTLYMRMGDYAKAAPYYLEAKSIREKTLGKGHPDYATSLSLLGEVYIARGDYKTAEALYLEARSIREKTLGKSHPDYATILSKLGSLYQDLDDYPQAEALLLQAKSIREKVQGKQHPDYATILSRLGALYQDMGDYKKAEPYYQQTRSIREQTLGTDHPDYATALNYLGSLYQDMGDYQKAATYDEQARAIREKTLGKLHPDYADALSNLGRLYEATNDYAKAATYYLEAKSIREKTLGTGHPDYARSLDQLGNLYKAQDNYQKAVSLYQEAKTVRMQLFGKNHPAYANSLNNLGHIYRLTGDYKKAEACYLEAKSIRAHIFGISHPAYADALNSLGTLYEDMGDYEKAEASYLEAQAIREKVLGKDHPDYAASLRSLAGLYMDLNNYTKAEKYITEAKNITEKLRGKDHPDYARSLNDLGVLYNNQGQYKKAAPFYLEAKAIWEKRWGKTDPDYAVFIDNLGLIYFHMQDYGQAEKYYLQAKSIRENILGKTHPDYARSLGHLGDLALQSGKDHQAEAYYQAAINIAASSFGEQHPDYITYLNKLSTLYKNKSDYPRAASLDREISAIIQKMVNKNFLFLSEQQRNQYWNAEKGYMIGAYSLAQFYAAPLVNACNYNNTLFTKGRLLLTTNSIRSSVYASGNPRLIGQYNQLDSLRNEIRLIEKSQNYKKEAAESLQAQIENLDKAITQSSKSYRDLKADIQLQWQDIQKQLKPSEAAIEFVHFRLYDKKWTDSIMYAALILRPGMSAPQWIPLFEQKELTAAMGDSAQTLTQQSQIEHQYSDTNPILYRLIWSHLEKGLTGVKKVYYSPSGLLYKIALGALPTGVRHQRLTDTYDLELVSSTREIAHLKKEASSLSPKDTTAIYGGLTYDIQQERLATTRTAPPSDSKGAADKKAFNISRFRKSYPTPPATNSRGGFSQWPYLPGTAREVRHIAAAFDSTHRPYKYYSASQGNEASFKQLSGTETSVIHLATHGFFLPDIQNKIAEEVMQRLGGSQEQLFEHPLLRSGLILSGANRQWLARQFDMDNTAEDGILTADEISRLNLTKTRLVVLSACETGLGEVNNSEGVFGLQRAFKLAGVESLIMSLWKVPDDATAELMVQFYQQWLAGHSKQAAFKIAQQKIRAQFKSPFYWAAFVMMD